MGWIRRQRYLRNARYLRNSRYLKYSLMGALTQVGAFVACGTPPQPGTQLKRSPETAIVLVATERSSRGGRLVGVRADGARQYELTELPGASIIIDRSPTLSPDGKRVVFASNRDGADIEATNLYSVPVTGGAVVRLTKSKAVDRDPRISSDGRWLYFCSNRQGSFDLYRAPFAGGRLGAASALVVSDEQILSPSLSPDGSQVVYMAVDAQGRSRLWRAPTDGSAEPWMLSDGPLDLTPAWGPDDEIVFAARAPGRDDADLYVMPSTGGERKRLLSTPLTDETGPRFSEDGRFVFAIGMYRGNDGKPLLGSVIVLDRREKNPTYRALHDSAAVESRIGLAILPDSISPAALRRNPDYAVALEQVVLQEWIRNEGERRRAAEEKSRREDPR